MLSVPRAPLLCETLGRLASARKIPFSVVPSGSLERSDQEAATTECLRLFAATAPCPAGRVRHLPCGCRRASALDRNAVGRDALAAAGSWYGGESHRGCCASTALASPVRLNTLHLVRSARNTAMTTTMQEVGCASEVEVGGPVDVHRRAAGELGLG